jgi:hypothetical protein
LRASRGPGRPIEGRKKAVPNCADLLSSKSVKFVPDQRVVSLEEISPRLIPNVRSLRGGTNQVSEQHGGQNAVGGRTPPNAREEVLDLIEHRVLIPDKGKVIAARQLNVCGSGNRLGKVATVARITVYVTTTLEN